MPNSGELKWLYDNKNRENGFRLGKFHFFNKKQQKAWYCPICDLLLINCKEE